MPTFLFETVDFETSVFDAIARRGAQMTALRETATPELAEDLVNLADKFGSFMQPGVLTALAKTGLSNSPEILGAAIESEAERHAHREAITDRVGDNATVRTALGVGGITGEGMRTAGRLTKSGLNRVWDWTSGFREAVGTPFETPTRAAFTTFDALYEEGMSRPLRFAMQMEADRGGDFTTFLGGTPTGASAAGPAGQLLGTFGEARHIMQEGRPTDRFTPLTEEGRQRAREVGPDASPRERMQVGTEDFGRRYRATGRSPGLIAAQQFLGMEEGDPDLGEGFIPGGRSGMQSWVERHGLESIPQAQDMFGLEDEIAADPEFQQQLLEAGEQTFMYQGEPLSMGRFAAHEVFEPGSREFDMASGMIDFAILARFDPASVGLSSLSRMRRARRQFGVVEGHRKGIDTDTMRDEFLNKPHGQRLAEDLAGRDNWDEVYLALGRPRHREVVSEVVDATTPEDVRTILGRELGFRIREAPRDPRSILNPNRTLPGTSRKLGEIRLLDDLPRAGYVSAHNIDEAIPSVRSYMINSQVPSHRRAEIMDEVGRLRDGDVTGFNIAMKRVYQATDEVVDAERIRKGQDPLNLTQRFGDIWDDFSIDGVAYYVDEMGNSAPFPGVKRATINGRTVDLPTAQLQAEMVEQTVPLFDIRQIRRATSSYGKMLDTPGVDQSLMAMDAFMSHVWKPMALARPAWPVRVVGDEQLRMAVHGMDSVFRHPMSWLAWATGRKGDLPEDTARALARQNADEAERLMLRDSSEFAAVQQGRDAGWRGTDPSGANSGTVSDTVWTGDYIPYTKVENNPEYIQAVSDELTMLGRDDLARRAAGGLTGEDLRSIGAWRDNHGQIWRNTTDPQTGRTRAQSLSTTDATKEWLWEGGGVQIREDLARLRAEGPRGRALDPESAAHYGSEYFDEAIRHNRQFVDDYVDAVHRRLRIKTGDHPELIQGISTGKFGKVDIFNKFRDHQEMAKVLRRADIWDALPARARGPRALEKHNFESGGSLVNAGRMWDKGVEWMFHHLGAVPTNVASRSPAFKQAYWKNMEGFSPFMTEDVLNRAARNADQAGLPEIANNIRRRGGAQKSDRTTLAMFDDADQLSKVHAVDETRKLLYDLTKRSQFMDIARNIFPFGEAFKEIISTWARLGARQPEAARRGQMLIEGARESGFFYYDEQTDEEMFAYPFSGMLLDRELDLPEGEEARMAGRVQGLNLVTTTVLPGIGPIAQWPLSKTVPDHPSLDWLNEHLFPFGRERASTLGEFVDSTLPPHVRHFFQGISQGGVDERQWENTIGDIAMALMRSDEFAPHEKDDALEAAMSAGPTLFMVRSFAGATLPTSPSIEWRTEDQDGRLFHLEVLADDYRKLQDKHDGDSFQATQEFMDEYGIDPMYVSQPKTRTLRHRALAQPGVDWEQNNKHLVDELDLTVGLFAPEETDGEFDWEKYIQAISDGDLETLTADQQIMMANNLRGWMKYNKIRDEVTEEFGATDEARAILSRIKKELKERHPGFDQMHVTVPEGARYGDLIEEIEHAVTDPELSSDPALRETEAFEAAEIYTQARNMALESVRARGEARTLEAEVAAYGERVFLQQLGQELVGRYPEFESMWRNAFQPEVRN